MLTLRLDGEENFYRSLIRIERRVEEQSHEFLDEMADWIISDIREHWSTQSPSAGGMPPAIDTGNLDSSLTTEQQYRSAVGQFAARSEAAKVFIRINTEEGDNPADRGNYAQALEEGTYKMQARPFLEPALDRARDIMPTIAKRNIKL
jgi:hypothetical protein